MNEGQMHHAIRCLGAAPEAVDVFQVAFEGCAARCSDDGGIGVVPRKAQDGMTVRNEFFYGSLTDEAGGASDEDMHG